MPSSLWGKTSTRTTIWQKIRPGETTEDQPRKKRKNHAAQKSNPLRSGEGPDETRFSFIVRGKGGLAASKNGPRRELTGPGTGSKRKPRLVGEDSLLPRLSRARDPVHREHLGPGLEKKNSEPLWLQEGGKSKSNFGRAITRKKKSPTAFRQP